MTTVVAYRGENGIRWGWDAQVTDHNGHTYRVPEVGTGAKVRRVASNLFVGVAGEASLLTKMSHKVTYAERSPHNWWSDFWVSLSKRERNAIDAILTTSTGEMFLSEGESLVQYGQPFLSVGSGDQMAVAILMAFSQEGMMAPEYTLSSVVSRLDSGTGSMRWVDQRDVL